MLRRELVAGLLLLAGCSTVETSGTGLTSPNASTDRIQLRVRTGNEQMDRTVYELVYQQFADVLPLREAPPYTGSFDVTFDSSTQSAFLGSSSTIASTGSKGWYTGAGIVSGAASALSAGAVFDWQNSTMLAVLRGSDGGRLWSADYSYKGGWEMSGWVVNTPEEAARLVAKRLKARYLADTSR